MLLPLNRQKFEQLIPLVATGAQYIYYWGKISDFLSRLLVSVSVVMVILLVSSIFPVEELQSVKFFLGLFAGLYWLWGPVFWASWRNFNYRKYRYTGFWRGEVWDVYVTEELIGQEENVNAKGDLVIVENRQRQLTLEVGDESGFMTRLQVPLRREHQAIAPGDMAEMIVLSSRGDLGNIAEISDIYIPRSNLWVSDYPYLRRDEFEAVSRRIDREFNTRSPQYDDDYGYPEDNYDEFDQPTREPRSTRRNRTSDWDDRPERSPEPPSRRNSRSSRTNSSDSQRRSSRSSSRRSPRNDQDW
jgi:hypothetical protein